MNGLALLQSLQLPYGIVIFQTLPPTALPLLELVLLRWVFSPSADKNCGGVEDFSKPKG